VEVKKFIKRAKYIALFISIGVVVFIVGSFNPNQHTINSITLKVEKEFTQKAQALGLHEPSFEFNNDDEFVVAMNKCIDFVNFQTEPHLRIPSEMIIGQAALESAWGTSRFAREGNNLFGIRTYDTQVPHMLPQGVKKWKGWGVRVFESKCNSVRFFVDLLNNHHAYEDFRKTRAKMMQANQPLDGTILIKTLTKYSTTDNYADLVISIIKRLRGVEE
tara:strand:+ start:1940 stop:2593 length:654 start_codon:yes stop_codon:yes gene_type:complete